MNIKDFINIMLLYDIIVVIFFCKKMKAFRGRRINYFFISWLIIYIAKLH